MESLEALLQQRRSTEAQVQECLQTGADKNAKEKELKRLLHSNLESLQRNLAAGIISDADPSLDVSLETLCHSLSGLRLLNFNVGDSLFLDTYKKLLSLLPGSPLRLISSWLWLYIHDVTKEYEDDESSTHVFSGDILADEPTVSMKACPNVAFWDSLASFLQVADTIAFNAASFKVVFPRLIRAMRRSLLIRPVPPSMSAILEHWLCVFSDRIVSGSMISEDEADSFHLLAALLAFLGVSNDFKQNNNRLPELAQYLTENCVERHSYWSMREASAMHSCLQGCLELMDISPDIHSTDDCTRLAVGCVLCHRAWECLRIISEPIDVGLICLSETESTALTVLTSRAETLIGDIAFKLLSANDPKIPEALINTVVYCHNEVSNRHPSDTVSALRQTDAAVFCLKNLTWGMADKIEEWRKFWDSRIRSQLLQICEQAAALLGGNELDTDLTQWQRAFTIGAILSFISMKDCDSHLGVILSRLFQSATPNRPTNLKQLLVALNPLIDNFGATLMSDPYPAYYVGEAGVGETSVFPVEDFRQFLYFLEREKSIPPWLMLLVNGYQMSSEDSYKSRLIKCLANTIQNLKAEHSQILNNFVNIIVFPKYAEVSKESEEEESGTFVYHRLCDDFAGLLAASIPILASSTEGQKTLAAIAQVANSMSDLYDNRTLLCDAINKFRVSAAL